MGTKFAHFSVLDTDVNETIELLKSIPKRPSMVEMAKRMFPEEPDMFKKLQETDEAEAKLLLRYMESSTRTYYLGKNQDWTTVFSEEFSFESIDNYSLPLSKKNSKTFLTVGLFDEDVFVLSIIKEGKFLTHHVSGAAEAYGMKESLGNTNTFAQVFNIVTQKDKLGNILRNNNDDLYKKISELEKLLNIKLWINRTVPRELRWKKVVC